MKPTTVFLVCFIGSVGAFNLPIDADGNGKVDFVEYKAAMGILFATDINEAQVIAALQLEFNKLDKDSSGELSKKEVRMAFRSFKQKFNQYDTNPKDKILSFEEFIAGVEAEIDGLVYNDFNDKYKQAFANAYAVLSTGITRKELRNLGKGIIAALG